MLGSAEDFSNEHHKNAQFGFLKPIDIISDHLWPVDSNYATSQREKDRRISKYRLRNSVNRRRPTRERLGKGSRGAGKSSARTRGKVMRIDHIGNERDAEGQEAPDRICRTTPSSRWYVDYDDDFRESWMQGLVQDPSKRIGWCHAKGYGYLSPAFLCEPPISCKCSSWPYPSIMIMITSVEPDDPMRRDTPMVSVLVAQTHF